MFIKAILQVIPTYSMMYFLLLKSFCEELEQIIARFWWQKDRGLKGIHWCEWKRLCELKDNEGLGFR